jgi:hypothetical protein
MMEGSVELKKTRCDWRERKKKFQSIKSKTFFLLFEEQVWWLVVAAFPHSNIKSIKCWRLGLFPVENIFPSTSIAIKR